MYSLDVILYISFEWMNDERPILKQLIMLGSHNSSSFYSDIEWIMAQIVSLSFNSNSSKSFVTFGQKYT